MDHEQRSEWSMSRVAVVLLVLMGLIGAAITLPAIQQAREAARRTHCKKYTLFWGMALHTYHEAFQTFPPGWVAVRGPHSSKQEQSAYAVATYILPGLDMASLSRGIDFQGADPSFQTQAARPGFEFARHPIESFLCPSDDGPVAVRSSSGLQMGTTNYVVNFGVGLPERGHDPRMMQGIFGENSSTRIRDIRDGTTNVIFLRERRRANQGRDWPAGKVDGAFLSYWAGLPSGTNPLAIVATATTGVIEPANSDAAHAWLEDNSQHALNMKGPLNGVVGPSPALQKCGVNRASNGQQLSGLLANEVSAGFSSHHENGVQVLMGDGSGRFVSNNVDPQTLINMMRRADGERLGEF